MRPALSLSAAALRWALRCYREHWPVVLGLSLVPTVQRFLVVRYDDVLAGPVAIGSEVVVGLVRLWLLVLIVTWMLAGLAAAGIDRRGALARLKAAIDARRTAFLLQLAVLAVAFVVFDVLPNAAIALWVPDADRDTVTALLVAVKNPTVIAMTLLWMVGVARALIVEPVSGRAPVGR